MLWYFKYVKMV